MRPILVLILTLIEDDVCSRFRHGNPITVTLTITRFGAGFDMIVFSFGSGFDLENDDPAYIEQMRKSIGYANSRGIEIGG